MKALHQKMGLLLWQRWRVEPFNGQLCEECHQGSMLAVNPVEQLHPKFLWQHCNPVNDYCLVVAAAAALPWLDQGMQCMPVPVFLLYMHPCVISVLA
jgi:hypothetical protein